MGAPRPGRRAQIRFLTVPPRLAVADDGARVFGRRRGRRLRPGRERLLHETLPRVKVEIPAVGEQDPRRLFAPASVRAVWLETGFGAGEHLAWQAEQNPDVGIIGAEPYVNGVASLLRHIDERSLRNVRILPDGVVALLAVLPPASIDRLFVLFPDPWPKRRHHWRRILRPTTIAQFARILGDGAELRFATDDAGLLRWVLYHMLDSGEFHWPVRRPTDWREPPADWPQTRYDGKARAQARPVSYLRFVRSPRLK